MNSHPQEASPGGSEGAQPGSGGLSRPAPGGRTLAQSVVVDTNVVLDMWWFCDNRCADLVAVLESGALQWYATASMRAELAGVLERTPFTSRPESCNSTLASFDRLVLIVDPAARPAALACTDADDQKFVDLALARGARWLVSRDRALLRLARRASLWRCAVLTPEQWTEAMRAA